MAEQKQRYGVFLKQQQITITEFDDAIVRKLFERITVISKGKLLVRFKDGTEIEQEISTEK